MTRPRLHLRRSRRPAARAVLAGGTLIALLAGLALLAGCGARGEEGGANGAAEKPINVRVLKTATTTFEEYLTISGGLRPVRGTDVSAQESGVVEAVPHDKGSLVEAGGVLVRLDRELLEAQMRAADADLELAVYNDERADKLFEAKQISREERLTIRTRREQAEAQADVARLRYQRAAIEAPFTGIVSDRYVELGQLVAAGTPVARVVDPYTLKLAGAATEREVQYVKEGTTAVVILAGLDRTVAGQVHWVSFEAEPHTGKFQVEIWIENPSLALRPGIVAEAQVLRDTHENVVIIPRDAVVQTPRGTGVFVVEDERAVLKDVELGADQGLMTVVDEGLAPAELLIVRGHREVVDGSRVKIQEEATAADGSLAQDPEEVRAVSAFQPLGERAATDEASR
jgi:membrane fusion protein (multidrug efflux system)